MSKLKEFAEFLLDVSKVGVYDRREDENEDWVTFTCDVDRHYDTYLVYNEFNSGDLRLKPKEEEKKKIPLEFSDITPNTVFRRSINSFIKFSFSDNKHIHLYTSEGDEFVEYEYKNIMHLSYSTDSGKTWKGCYKYED